MNITFVLCVALVCILAGAVLIVLQAGAVDAAKANAALGAAVAKFRNAIGNGVRWALSLFAQKP